MIFINLRSRIHNNRDTHIIVSEQISIFPTTQGSLSLSYLSLIALKFFISLFFLSKLYKKLKIYYLRLFI